MTLTNFRIVTFILMLAAVIVGKLFVDQALDFLYLFLGLFMASEGVNQLNHSKKGTAVVCFVIAVCLVSTFFSYFIRY